MASIPLGGGRPRLARGGFQRYLVPRPAPRRKSVLRGANFSPSAEFPRLGPVPLRLAYHGRRDQHVSVVGSQLDAAGCRGRPAGGHTAGDTASGSSRPGPISDRRRPSPRSTGWRRVGAVLQAGRGASGPGGRRCRRALVLCLIALRYQPWASGIFVIHPGCTGQAGLRRHRPAHPGNPWGPASEEAGGAGGPRYTAPVPGPGRQDSSLQLGIALIGTGGPVRRPGRPPGRSRTLRGPLVDDPGVLRPGGNRRRD